VIRGGAVVDGTGVPVRPADVAIDGDRITAVGTVVERGRRELDAAGRLVTPGFVDIHTHLDAQLFWDPVASPSSWHGVTTLVLGNCGVTWGPASDRADALVETIPRMRDAVAALGRDPLELGVAGKLPNVAGPDGPRTWRRPSTACRR
jgi:N-acyl-D-aspartate/D-glutamate deacylase